MNPGTFEYIESKIRSDAKGTLYGRDFEWLCKWFLLNAPKYKQLIEHVWLWDDWPGRWGVDTGIDLVAETKMGDLWAIQSKAWQAQRSLSLKEIDSFLRAASRRDFSFRLLMSTSESLSRHARSEIEAISDHIPTSYILRGDLATAQIRWPTRIGGKPKQRPRFTPRAHQSKAIREVIAGFKASDRGKLIMACGTGKTLTSLWIAERMKASRTLVLVPSLSLISQLLDEWSQHAAKQFDYLAVCSDETVAKRGKDHAVTSTNELGIPPTTDVAVIRRFLRHRSKSASVVFSTYQSSHRIAAAQGSKGTPKFDLVIADEAHRCTGHVESTFTTVLDGKKIKARKRLFMTATPRFFTDRVKQRAEEQDYELASMDDEEKFGKVFHELTFDRAIRSDPPLLTDYRVVVIGVASQELKEWVEEGRLVRTQEGIETDARTLATHIGLAKAMRKYELRRIITFHSSVRKSRRFTDRSFADSFPSVLDRMKGIPKPSGELWTSHISGDTPAGRRKTILSVFEDLPRRTRGILSNCACLGEGVDVPVLDGIAFIDPRSSTVDIIQAVGRVMRRSPKKHIGTLVIPVFVEDSEDAEVSLANSTFNRVWQVLLALRAHDTRLADELDQLRLNLGRRKRTKGRIELPKNIKVDIPTRIEGDLINKFRLRVIERTTRKPPLSVEQILEWADAHFKRQGDWPMNTSGEVIEAPGEKWMAISAALKAGTRGLPGGSSLSKLLVECRGAKKHLYQSKLSESQILSWIDDYKERTGHWPTPKSGEIFGRPGETWEKIDQALRGGSRGLPGDSSLANLLHFTGRRRHRHRQPALTESQIVEWAKAEHKAKGKWPTLTSGSVYGQPEEQWHTLDIALHQGHRGLPGGTSLARLLAGRGLRRHTHKQPDLTTAQILTWADAEYERTGRWPTRNGGTIHQTEGETWARIDNCLQKGFRSLSGGTSLARLLAEHRGVRNRRDLPHLSFAKIVEWAKSHKDRTGEWPTKWSGEVIESVGETWSGVDSAINRGTRGLSKKYSTLAKLLSDRCGVHNNATKLAKPLAIDEILDWADSHFERSGEWPTSSSGEVHDASGENWNAVSAALRVGSRGLPSGSSLAQLLEKNRNAPNRLNRPSLNEQQILRWADEHFDRSGEWPTQSSGQLTTQELENWQAIDLALRIGVRGLPGGTSLAKLLKQNRSVRRSKRPRLTIEQILEWADAYHDNEGKWPFSTSGRISAADQETWAAVDAALRNGARGLPGGDSLSRLLFRERDVKTRPPRPRKDRPDLTEEQVLSWADSHRQETGEWPNAHSGMLLGATEESWGGIDSALTVGRRGLAGGSSLAKLLTRKRNKAYPRLETALSEKEILRWADEHFQKHGDWPNRESGEIDGKQQLTWRTIDRALQNGHHGFEGGTSLLRLLARHRNVRNRTNLPPLTLETILKWADDHFQATGKWPNHLSGQVIGVQFETWGAVQRALQKGTRGLTSGSSIARVLEKHRGIRNRKRLRKLSEVEVLDWADVYFKSKGSWPNRKSGEIPESGGETWSSVDSALTRGTRGLPRMGSLRQFLSKNRAVRNIQRLPDLSVDEILHWADEYWRNHGSWPTLSSGEIPNSGGETWSGISQSLSVGRRGLEGGSSLPSLLAKYRAYAHQRNRPPLTAEQIKSWVLEHHQRHNEWPHRRKSKCEFGETWNALDQALRSGSRGLEGGSSLPAIIKECQFELGRKK